MLAYRRAEYSGWSGGSSCNHGWYATSLFNTYTIHTIHTMHTIHTGTVVVRLSSAAFKHAIDDHPQALTQLIRVVARRLQRITFLVMYRCVYLVFSPYVRDSF